MYEARVRGDESTTEGVVKSGDFLQKASVHILLLTVTPVEKDDYPLVIKILFNYDIFASVSSIWQFHEPELVTTIDSLVKGRMTLYVLLSSVSFSHNTSSAAVL